MEINVALAVVQSLSHWTSSDKEVETARRDALLSGLKAINNAK